MAFVGRDSMMNWSAQAFQINQNRFIFVSVAYIKREAFLVVIQAVHFFDRERLGKASLRA